jgi:hypothetical protein
VRVDFKCMRVIENKNMRVESASMRVVRKIQQQKT